MNILCTICMRGGSKGVPNKNLKLINGKPLLSYTINQALKSKIFDKVVVSTDSKKISDMANYYGAESWFIRPKNLSSDTCSKIKVIKHLLKESEARYKKKFKYIMDLDVTAPLRNISDIKNSFKQFEDSNSPILFSVNHSRKNPYFNMIEKKISRYSLINENKVIFSRQKAPKVYDMNASIYIWKRKALINQKNVFVKNNNIYIMPENRSYDIDSKLDFEIVSFLLAKKYYDKNKKYK